MPKSITRFLIVKNKRSGAEARLVARRPLGLTYNEYVYQIVIDLPEERPALAAPPFRLALPNPLAPIVNIQDVR